MVRLDMLPEGLVKELLETAEANARVRRLEEINEQHREENGRLREVIREQGEFIQSLKRQIRDFLGQPWPTQTP